MDLLVQPGDEGGDNELAARHIDQYLQTKHTSAKLQSRLLKTEHDARVYVEEQGANILYLALGMMGWYESEENLSISTRPDTYRVCSGTTSLLASVTGI